MALPLFRTQPLIAPEPPRLINAPKVYEQSYQDQSNSVLRLYFNQLKNFMQLFSTNTGGSLLQFPNGGFHQDGNTFLTGNITNVSTTPIPVVSTLGFIAAGGLIIGDEIILYTGKTSTTFTGITRGALGTSGSAHTSGAAVTEAQVLSSSSVALPIAYTATDASNGVTVDGGDNTHVVFAVTGRYNIEFSAQLLNFTTAEDNVTLWFRQNGVDIPFSAGVVTVPSKHGSSPGARIVSWNQYVDIMAVNDYVQLYLASASGNTVVATLPAGTSPVTPISPSIILTATFVSALFT